MMGMASRIECLFFSEFHPTLGPKITYQVSYTSKYDDRNQGKDHNFAIITIATATHSINYPWMVKLW